jgi:hypothetical protein
MIRTGEIRKGNGQIQFSLRVLEATQLQPQTETGQWQPRPFVRAPRNQPLWLPSACRVVICVMHGWSTVVDNYPALAG